MGIGKILAISLGTIASIGAIGGISAAVIVNKQNSSASVNTTVVNDKEATKVDLDKEDKKSKGPISDEEIEKIKKEIKGSGDYEWVAGANSDLKKKTKPLSETQITKIKEEIKGKSEYKWIDGAKTSSNIGW